MFSAFFFILRVVNYVYYLGGVLPIMAYTLIVKFLSKAQPKDLGSYISSNLNSEQATTYTSDREGVFAGQLRHKTSCNRYSTPLIEVTTGCQFVITSINSGLIDLSYCNGNKEGTWHR